MVYYAVFTIEYLHPVMKDYLQRDAISNAEGYVDIGPLIATPKCHGTCECTSCDTMVSPRQLQDAITYLLSLL